VGLIAFGMAAEDGVVAVGGATPQGGGGNEGAMEDASDKGGLSHDEASVAFVC
jgi:hypothetical protein